MCGIAGAIVHNERGAPLDGAVLDSMASTLRHRGPDGSGAWLSESRRVGFAHRRLAIIDLSARASQPMATSDGLYRIVFNGEIYNYRSLAKELIAKGYRFRSQSDTEVLLALYARHGTDMLPMLRGMYAFAIWDEAQKRLFLARDALGIKPLYWSDDGYTLRFASEVKTLRGWLGDATSPEPAGHVGFYLWGAVPEPYSLYREIRALPAGTWLWVDAEGRHTAGRFFSITQEILAAEDGSRPAGEGALRDAFCGLEDSVAAHLVSDVPVGVFLSAGLDSTLIAGLASQHHVGPVRTLTLGFKEFAGTPQDETVLAAQTAESFGCDHATRWTTRDDFERELDRFLAFMDQPSTDGSNSYLVSQAAARSGLKVAFSGLGGDELFAGYPSFRQVPRLSRSLAPLAAMPGLGRAFRWLWSPASSVLGGPKSPGILEYGGTLPGAYLLRRALFMPWELPGLLDAEMVSRGLEELDTRDTLHNLIRGIRSPRLAVTALELAWYMRNQLLRDTDWASMAHSVEVRVPLVDVPLLRSVLRALASGLRVSKRALATMLPAPPPASILARSKTGFSVPLRQWMSPPGPKPEVGLRPWARFVYGRYLSQRERPLTRVQARA